MFLSCDFTCRSESIDLPCTPGQLMCANLFIWTLEMATAITMQDLSRIVRKPDFCLCENKGADQLRSNCEADQRLCFRHSDSTISLLPKSEISSFLPFSDTAQTGLCRTWSETPKTGFLASRLISCLQLSILRGPRRHCGQTDGRKFKRRAIRIRDKNEL